MKNSNQNMQKNQLLDPNLKSKFKFFGFDTLTEIQIKAVPTIFKKIDSLIVAPTGSGKTECSVIPIFTRTLQWSNGSRRGGPPAGSSSLPVFWGGDCAPGCTTKR